jgi:DNA mismatch endonuclease (patch repair protein)
MDIWSQAKRSEMMAKIKSKGNKTTELRFLALLKERGITGWRRHARLPGRPDFYFPNERVAIFLDGCFWHGCGKCYREPSTNIDFWRNKLVGNRRRDRRNDRALRTKGVRVIRIWEHSLKNENLSSVRLTALVRMLKVMRSRNSLP